MEGTRGLTLLLGERGVEKMKPIDILTGGMHSRNIENRKCNSCGKDVRDEEFRDSLSRKEYLISGFCQKCQDSVFGVNE